MYVRREMMRPMLLSALVLAVAALVGACGSPSGASAASAASATPTCPPTVAFKSVNGTIQAVSGSTLTLDAANGTATQVTITSTTRVTKLVLVKTTDLAAGARVQVTTDASTTTAQRILVMPAGTGTGGGFRGAGANGTPGARANRGCIGRTGQAQGTRFPGLAGTVVSASSTQIVLDDAQSQMFTLAITPATIIETSAAGQVSDLTKGAKALVTGTSASGGIVARSITVES